MAKLPKPYLRVVKTTDTITITPYALWQARLVKCKPATVDRGDKIAVRDAARFCLAEARELYGVPEIQADGSG